LLACFTYQLLVGQNLYFHLNHPIRFVCITGPVVSIEDVASKYALLTVDDGSGATIVVKITRLEGEIANSVDCPSNTTIDNVNIQGSLGRFDVLVDDVVLDTGTVVKAKGTIDEWRGTKQIKLERIQIVRSTAEEIQEWEDVARWKREILDKPWVLGREKLEEMEQKHRDDREKELEKQQRKEEMKRAYLVKQRDRDAKRKAHEEKRERRRRKEEVMMNAGALI
jgi:hypothetical protein